MNTLMRLTLACSAALALGGVTAMAHHSAAAFDTQKDVTVNGIVKSYRFANPHVQLLVTVKKDDGSAVDMDVAFGWLRRYARSNSLRLADVAVAVVERTLPVEALMAAATAPPKP